MSVYIKKSMLLLPYKGNLNFVDSPLAKWDRKWCYSNNSEGEWWWWHWWHWWTVVLLVQEMGLEQPHIASARCLKHPLLHIKTRHLFLLRAGLYKTPNLKKDRQSHRRNPSLTDILDTSDRRFTNRCIIMEYCSINVDVMMLLGYFQNVFKIQEETGCRKVINKYVQESNKDQFTSQCIFHHSLERWKCMHK